MRALIILADHDTVTDPRADLLDRRDHIKNPHGYVEPSLGCDGPSRTTQPTAPPEIIRATERLATETRAQRMWRGIVIFSRHLACVTLIACAADAPFEVTANLTTSPSGTSSCDLVWVARATDRARYIEYDLYAPGAANAPTRSGQFYGAVTVTLTVSARSFFYQWSARSHDPATGSEYETASTAQIVNCT